MSCGKALAVGAPLIMGHLFDIDAIYPFFVMGGVGAFGVICAMFAFIGARRVEDKLELERSEKQLK